MRIHSNSIGLITNSAFYLFWCAIYSLTVVFLAFAKFRLAATNFLEASWKPKVDGQLTDNKNLLKATLS
jgi:hypothetical protein